jgi:hypothetical protein
MTMKYTLTNEFHGTSATVQVDKSGVLSARTVKRVQRELCGIHGCACGMYGLGVRGHQNGIEIDYAGADGSLRIIPRQTASA